MVEGCLLILLAGARQELFQGEKEPDGSTAAATQAGELLLFKDEVDVRVDGGQSYRRHPGLDPGSAFFFTAAAKAESPSLRPSPATSGWQRSRVHTSTREPSA